MSDGRKWLTPWRFAARAILTGSGLLSGLGIGPSAQPSAAAARNDKSTKDESGDRKDVEEKRSERHEGDTNDDAAKQTTHAEAQSDSREVKASNRDERRSRQEDQRERDSAESGKADPGASEHRQETQRQDTDNDSRHDSADGNDDDRRDFAQEVDDVPAPAPVVPTNPNVVLDDIPDIFDAELAVEDNTDVIADVSSSGGFAFARSGGVTAVSGPDGATIIQTGDIDETSTPGPIPDDGGNNDMDFVS